METLTMYYLVGFVVILHFAIGIAYLIYKIRTASTSSENPKTKSKTET